MRSVLFFGASLFGAALGLAASGCGSSDDGAEGTKETPAEDAGVEASGEDGGATDGTPDESSPDSGDASSLEWQSIREPGDPQGDCQSKDTTCAADFEQVYFAVESGTLHFEVRHYAPYPAADGSWELMMFPKDPKLVGHSLQLVAGKAIWWSADCSSGASSGLRHNGCHWLSDSEPAGVQYEWVAADRLMMHVPLAELLPAGVTELLVGVGGAPFAVQKTAEYTDRYPDELLVTSTEVQGLRSITLPAWQ